jgi:ABC-type protease/lipase transport system fused ATPase/permease subunit
MSILFTRLFKLLWLLFFILLIFLDRDIFAVKMGLIAFVLILAVITILRALESKKEWGEIVNDLDEDEKELFSHKS